jgi:hypothetical protein
VRTRPHEVLHDEQQPGEKGCGDAGSHAGQCDCRPKAQRARTRQGGRDTRVGGLCKSQKAALK